MDGCRDLYLSGYLHNQPPVFFTRCKVQTEGSEYEWISRDLFGEIEIHDYLSIMSLFVVVRGWSWSSLYHSD